MNDCIYVKNNIYIIDNENLRKLKIACIFDDFTMKCYEDIIDIIYLSPDNWQKKIIKNMPDILFVESIWKGKDNRWENIVSSKDEDKYMIMKDIINWCNKNNIPTVFWNKEDPINYKFFIKLAKLFDYVFTTDENSINKYKKDLNNNRVFSLLFAANPHIHNPIKYNKEKINKSFFAGTYYRNKFEERKVDLKKLLDLSIDYGELDIYDRHYNSENPLYYFPKKYNPYIKGYLDINDMYKTYKKYKIALNVNIIKNSPTMFSRRVFECLASGVPVISTYSLGINEIFKDIVLSSDNIEELKKEFINLQDERYYYDKVVRGIREVLNNHTYQNRLLFILEKIGTNVIYEKTTIGIIGKIESLDEYEILKKQYLNQSYKYKRLYIFTENKCLLNIKRENNIKFIFINETIMKEKINDLISVDYMSFFNIKNIYGNYYLEDLINSRLYCDAEIIGKKSFYKLENNKKKLINKDMDFKYVDKIDWDKCIIKKEIFNKKNIDDILQYIKFNKIYGGNYVVFSSDKSNLIIV